MPKHCFTIHQNPSTVKEFWRPGQMAGAGDAITYLSTAWDDSQHHDPVVIRPTAADTDIYAAILAGHSGTPCDHEVGGCGVSSPYGGGLENFPRFLEDWNPEILLFRGSLVSLTYAVQSTGLWGNGPYYRPPVRDWEVDQRFDQPGTRIHLDLNGDGKALERVTIGKPFRVRDGGYVVRVRGRTAPRVVFEPVAKAPSCVMANARVSAESGSMMVPASPSRRASLLPSFPAPMTGTPEASASRNTTPNPSPVLGMTNASARR